MSDTRRIRTILYDDERIEATELDLIHTPAIQRLYDLHQLGLADRIFLDASHSRLHHVVGVLQQVENLVAAIVRNLRNRGTRKFEYRDGDASSLGKMTADDLASHAESHRCHVRLMGLLHDLTHSPYGHTLEDEIHLIKSKHDEPQRQADAFFRLLTQYLGWLLRDTNENPPPTRVSRWPDAAASPKDILQHFLDAPDLVELPATDAFISFLAKEVKPLLLRHSVGRSMAREPDGPALITFFRTLHFAMRGLLYLDVIHKEKPEPKHIPSADLYPFEKLITAILAEANAPLRAEDAFHPQRDAFFLDIIGNTICADLLDYAKRDSFFAGLKLDYDVDRIVENFTLVSYWSRGDNGSAHPFPGPLLRTAISLFSHKLRIDVPGELLNLLQIRFYVYQRVLFHPTKCTAGAMLGSALQLVGWADPPPLHFAFIGDAVFLHQVSECVRIVVDLLEKHRGKKDTLDAELLASAEAPLLAVPPTGTLMAARKLLQDRKSQPIDNILNDLKASIQLLDRIFARRYFRTVFRLLPNVEIQPLNKTAIEIADVFLESDKRKQAERLIEEKAGIPHGSVVIHCPSGVGPRKIANMLILKEPEEKDQEPAAYPLRALSKIDRDIFETHQATVLAVEEMYRSMWRLSVSVAPPYHAQHERINACIPAILHFILSGGAKSGTVKNDPLMERELMEASSPDSITSSSGVFTHASGETETIREREWEVGRKMARLLAEKIPSVKSYLEGRRIAAESTNEKDVPSDEAAMDKLLERLVLSAVLKDAGDKVDPVPRKRKGKKEEPPVQDSPILDAGE